MCVVMRGLTVLILVRYKSGASEGIVVWYCQPSEVQSLREITRHLYIFDLRDEDDDVHASGIRG